MTIVPTSTAAQTHAAVVADLSRCEGLLRTWLQVAERQLAQPEKLDARALNRLGELIMSAAAWLSEREKATAFAAKRDASRPGNEGRP